MPSPPAISDLIYNVTTMNTEKKIRSFRAEVIGFLESHYGCVFEANANEKFGIYESIPLLDREGVQTDSYLAGFTVLNNQYMQYKATSICIADANGRNSVCSKTSASPVWDCVLPVVVGPSGYTFHGVFGQDQGQYSPPGDSIATGFYVIEDMNIPGITDGLVNRPNIEIKYFGECPIGLRR